jgi:hypothetical protein
VATCLTCLARELSPDAASELTIYLLNSPIFDALVAYGTILSFQ